MEYQMLLRSIDTYSNKDLIERLMFINHRIENLMRERKLDVDHNIEDISHLRQIRVLVEKEINLRENEAQLKIIEK